MNDECVFSEHWNFRDVVSEASQVGARSRYCASKVGHSVEDYRVQSFRIIASIVLGIVFLQSNTSSDNDANKHFGDFSKRGSWEKSLFLEVSTQQHRKVVNVLQNFITILKERL